MADRAAVYGRFAKYYDFIYENLVDYDADVQYLEGVFRRFLRKRPQIILDLGCGTGSHAIRFARRGYDVVGLDTSRGQLAVARRKAREAGFRIRLVHGNMGSFELDRTFDVVLCLFGGFGYLLKTRDVLGCFRCVRRHLAPNGMFAFEFWQSSGVRPPPDRSWLHRTGRGIELFRLAESRYDRRTRRLPIDFRFFVFRGRKLIDRFNEIHTVRTYTVPEMRRLLRHGGLTMQAAFEGVPGQGPTFRPAKKGMFRVFAVCRPATNLRTGRLRRTSGTGGGPRGPH